MAGNRILPPLATLATEWEQGYPEGGRAEAIGGGRLNAVTRVVV